MGSDAFRSLFTLYQSKTKMSSRVQMVSPSHMSDSEDVADQGPVQLLKVCALPCKSIQQPDVQPVLPQWLRQHPQTG